MHKCLYSCTCLFVCAFVLEQVRRRLKSRQPGGRRCSKGFRLVPPTRTASVAAVHPRAGAGQIKRARADNTAHRAHRETRTREAERWRGAGKEVAPSVHASKTVSWQGNSLEDDTPATSSSWSGWKAGRLVGKKERPRCCFLIPRAANRAHRDMKSARRLGKVRETR